MTQKIKEVLENNKICVESLVDQQCAISAVKIRKVPICDECKEAQVILANFLSKLHLSTIKNVNFVLHCKKYVNEEEVFNPPLLRIKVNTEKCTSEDERKLSQGNYIIKTGFEKLFYHISQTLVTYLLQFKVTGSIMADFAVISLNSDQ